MITSKADHNSICRKIAAAKESLKPGRPSTFFSRFLDNADREQSRSALFTVEKNLQKRKNTVMMVFNKMPLFV